MSFGFARLTSKHRDDGGELGSTKKTTGGLWDSIGVVGVIGSWMTGMTKKNKRKKDTMSIFAKGSESSDDEGIAVMKSNARQSTSTTGTTSVADLMEPGRQSPVSGGQEDLGFSKPTVIAVPTPNKPTLSQSRSEEYQEPEGMISVYSPLDSASLGSSTEAAGSSSSNANDPTPKWLITESSADKRGTKRCSPEDQKPPAKRKSPRFGSTGSVMLGLYDERDGEAQVEDSDDFLVHKGSSTAEYTPTCFAITINKTRCALLPVDGADYCKIHCRTKPVHGTLVNQGRSELLRDTYFWNAPGTTQCRAISQRGTRCKLCSIAKWDMCRSHISHPPLRFVPFKVGETVENTDESLAGGDNTKIQVPDEKEEEIQIQQEVDVAYAAGLDEDLSSDSDAGGDDGADDDDYEEEEDHEDDEDNSSVESEESEDSRILEGYDEDAGDDWEPDHSIQGSQSDHSVQGNQRKNSRRTKKSMGDSEAENICQYVSPRGTRCHYKAAKPSFVCCRGHCYLEEQLKANVAAKKFGDDADEETTEVDDGQPRCYTFKEFLSMWEYVEGFTGEETDEVEATKCVRSSNQSMDPEDTVGQAKAQYGRLLPGAMRTMMTKIMDLKEDDVFLDIGHGLGNACLQAAFTAGCEARGIEVVFSRNNISGVYRDKMYHRHEKGLGERRKVGKVLLRHGRLEDECHRDFLTRGVTRAYVNNFNGVFAERSVWTNCKWFLDDYVAALFALMEPGAIMVTLHPLNLGITQEEANRNRRKHDLKQSRDASFFKVERVLLGKACDAVKWNQHSGNDKDIYVYKYTRLAQETGSEAVFMCCNPLCDVAKKGIAVKATTINEEGRCVINQCECKITAKNLRRQGKKYYPE